MCFPMNNKNAASLGMGTTMVGAGIAAYGQVQQGSIEANRMEYNASVARDNAALAELSAKDREKQGKIDARIYRRRVKAFIGEQRAAYGASGVDVNVGAPADTILDTALAGEADVTAIQRNSALEAWGLKSQAAGLRAEAGMFDVAGETAEAAGYLAAGTTLLTGASSVALQYFQYKNIGAGAKKGGNWKPRKGNKKGAVYFGRTRTNIKSSGVLTN